MLKPIDTHAMYVAIDKLNLNPTETTIALAVFAKEYSDKSDSSLITDFIPFKANRVAIRDRKFENN